MNGYHAAPRKEFDRLAGFHSRVRDLSVNAADGAVNLSAGHPSRTATFCEPIRLATHTVEVSKHDSHLCREDKARGGEGRSYRASYGGLLMLVGNMSKPDIGIRAFKTITPTQVEWREIRWDTLGWPPIRLSLPQQHLTADSRSLLPHPSSCDVF